MPASLSQRWTFTQATPLGDVNASYELTADGLRFRSDGEASAGPELLRWGDMAEAGTAVLDLPAGRGGPDMARWVPDRLEWLLISPSAPGARAVMRPLPASDARDAIVDALRQRLGSRWVGDELPLRAAQQRFRLGGGGGDTLKVAGLVLSVLGCLFLLLLAAAWASALLALPAGFAAGGWCFARGLAGLRDALQMSNTPTAKVASAALGIVELQGRAVADRPVAAGASGVPSVWWDVAVDVWYDHRDDGGWRQVMARHGGSADTLVLEDASGRVPVWLRGADVLLEEHAWESDRHVLPETGVALLAGTAFAWNGGRRLRVRETRIEAGGPVYVHGTLDEARHLPAAGEQPLAARTAASLRTGAWRRALLAALPAPLRPTVAVTVAYLDLLLGVGRGGERRRQPDGAPPPSLEPAELLVWKGRAGRPLIVSDRHETAAIGQLRRRSLWLLGGGGLVLCWCLDELIHLF